MLCFWLGEGGGCKRRLPGLKFQQAGDTPSPPAPRGPPVGFFLSTPPCHPPPCSDFCSPPPPHPQPRAVRSGAAGADPKSPLAAERRRARAPSGNISNCLCPASSVPHTGSLRHVCTSSPWGSTEKVHSAGLHAPNSAMKRASSERFPLDFSSRVNPTLSLSHTQKSVSR